MKGADIGKKLSEPIFPLLPKLFIKLWRRTPESVCLSAFRTSNVKMMVTVTVEGVRAIGR
jgi:hypothetical protein